MEIEPISVCTYLADKLINCPPHNHLMKNPENSSFDHGQLVVKMECYPVNFSTLPFYDFLGVSSGSSVKMECLTTTTAHVLSYFVAAGPSSVCYDFLASSSVSSDGRNGKRGQNFEKDDEISMASKKPANVDDGRAEGPWMIRKKLTVSDVSSSLMRIILGAKQVEEHLLPRLGGSISNDGKSVMILDLDTHSKHQLNLTRWKSTGSTVFNCNWFKDFVLRRGLKPGDEVGFRCDESVSCYYFSVLSRAAGN